MKIGIYRLSDEALKKPEEERTYKQRALYDTEAGEWHETSDGRVLFDEPDEKTIDAFLEAYGNVATRVLEPDDVPGDIVVPDEPPVTVEKARGKAKELQDTN